MMPSLIKKLLICASADGLILKSTDSKNSESRSLRLDYGSQSTSLWLNVQNEVSGSVLEAHGIIGVLNLVSKAYLVVITRREQIALINGHAIYAVRDVHLIPLSSELEAEKAILAAQKTTKNNISTSNTADGDETEESDVDHEAETSSIGDNDENFRKEPEDEAAALDAPKGPLKKSTTYLKNVVQEKGKYGRFADRWFSRGGNKADMNGSQGMEKRDEEQSLTSEQTKQTTQSLSEQGFGAETEDTEHDRDIKGADDTHKGDDSNKEEGTKDTKTPLKQQNAIEQLSPRILRGARLYFSSGGFYFSYDHDLSASVGQQNQSASSVPLWKRFDSLFFWNRHLMSPFITAGQDSFVLPILQGFVGQRAFSIAPTEGSEKDVVARAVEDIQEVVETQVGTEEPAVLENKSPGASEFLLTLISRRSIQRAGLRYLRRGVNDNGYVANNVETEQILSSKPGAEAETTFSLMQVRGSIPLFFSQSPYSFKPLPVMFGSESTNQAAFAKHFQSLSKRYGQIQVASLVDKHGTEVSIGEAYEKHAKFLNDQGGLEGKSLEFEWFDFHSACKGMNFKNISILMDALQDSLLSFGWLVKHNNRNNRLQTGILRTNCMDCLDRTNVVQSAVAGWALQRQLAELGLNIDLQTDEKTQWFNTLWADNGDAISKQYAGTSALKGDFTRTRKRNWTGALSDFSLTLNRYYNNIFGDYFLQTCIDYCIGNAGPAIFDEFEADMMSQDYALDIRRVRQNAIDTCIKIVLEDPKEELVAGWTLSCPHEANTLRTLPFEECVVLLTNAAVYSCKFDWDTEKVGSFERIDLLDITKIWRGAYITSGLGPTHLDETKNVGFAIRYEIDGPAAIRTNTRSLQTEKAAVTGDSNNESNTDTKKQSKTKDNTSRVLAFKALPPKASAVRNHNQDSIAATEAGITENVCSDIQSAIAAAFRRDRGTQHLELEKPPEVEEKDVISVAEASKSTGYVESIGYSLKRLVWS